MSFDAATADFAEHREMLFGIAYNLLGTVADAEDVLQETWLSWASARGEHIADVRAYLARVAVNAALSRLRRARLETYVGPWLPEPLVTEADDAADGVIRAETVSMGLLVVLQTLTPLERAVFVLHEAFGYPHGEIAEMLGRSPAAVRQLAHRAREHVQARRPRYTHDPAVQQELTDRFLAAALGEDITALMEVLAPDVRLWIDGGGRQRAARQVIVGRDKIVRLLTAGILRYPLELTVSPLPLNGDPAAAVFNDGALYGAVVVDLSPEGDRICDIYSVVNPGKLASVADAIGTTMLGPRVSITDPPVTT